MRPLTWLSNSPLALGNLTLNINELTTKYQKGAKELGADVPKEITAKTKEANQYIKEAKAKIK